LLTGVLQGEAIDKFDKSKVRKVSKVQNKHFAVPVLGQSV
jgi:hypothetical protein